MVEFVSLQNIVLTVVVTLAALVLLPIILFVCVKMGTAGFFHGRDAFWKSKKEEREDGDKTREKEETG